MRVLFSVTYYSPYVSGLTLYVKRLAEALVKTGYQVSVISFAYDKQLITCEKIKGVNVHRVKPLFKISKGFISFDWIVQSWRMVQQSDTVVINLPQFEGFIPALFGRIMGKRVISVYHCEVILSTSIINFIIQQILKISNLLTLHLSHIVVTYTEDFAKHSKLLALISNKLRYIYPPINRPNTNQRIIKLLRQKIGSKDGFLIGVAARLAAEKGIEYLLESIPAISSKFKKSKFKIVVAGPIAPVGEEAYKKKVMKLVEKYKEYVVFLGEIREEDMGSFYSLIDVLVLPSVNSTEAFGMVQVEAMMMGVPVVATNLPGVRIPIAKTGMGITVPIKNSEKLAFAIAEILMNKKKYIKQKELIEKEFAMEKTIWQKIL